MTYPHRLLAIVAAIPAIVSAGLLFSPAILPLVLGLDLALVLVALGDLATLPRSRKLRVRRECGGVASLGRRHRVVLSFENPTRRLYRFRVRDDVPAVMDSEPGEFVLELPAGTRAEVSYDLTPRERGAWTLERVYGLVSSHFGLWRRKVSWPAETVLSVYPDLRQLTRYTVYARVNHLSLLGVRSTRRLGQDNEFERLRDYTEDDDHRHIDWRATARRRKLTVRAYQATRSQRVVFLVDCGRMMVSRHEGLSLLDHSLNAMLMLSYVALSRGDQVGLLSFSDRILGYVPPAGGRRQMDRLIHDAHDRFPELVESRFDDAFQYLARRCRKRTLVVLLTHVLDEVSSSEAGRQLAHLTGRHLPLAILLRDPGLFRILEDDPDESPERLYPAAAAASIVLWRARVLRKLERSGVLTLDVAPSDLTPSLISEYLWIKARHLL